MADRQKVTSVSYGLTFFSDSRLQSLSARLRNDKVYDLVHRISLVLQRRAKPTESITTGSLNKKKENPASLYDSKKASKWVQSQCASQFSPPSTAHSVSINDITQFISREYIPYTPFSTAKILKAQQERKGSRRASGATVRGPYYIIRSWPWDANMMAVVASSPQQVSPGGFSPPPWFNIPTCSCCRIL